MNLRKATVLDAEELVNLRIAMLKESGSVSFCKNAESIEKMKLFFEKAISDGSFIGIVAELDGKIVATGGLSVFAAPPSFNAPNGERSYLSNVYTMPRYRKHGLATQIVKSLIQEAEKCGLKQILLQATPKGLKMYKKLNFKTEKSLMRLYI